MITEAQIKELDDIMLNDTPIDVSYFPNFSINKKTGEIDPKVHDDDIELCLAETWVGKNLSDLCADFSKSIMGETPSKIVFIPVNPNSVFVSDEFAGQEGKIIGLSKKGCWYIRAAFVYLDGNVKPVSKITSSGATGIGTSSGTVIPGVSTTTVFDGWQTPELIDTIVNNDSIELVYKQHSSISYNFGGILSRVYKIIYSCQDGKWHISKQIFGDIISATEESYQFPD